jgi:hypothetical protein
MSAGITGRIGTLQYIRYAGEHKVVGTVYKDSVAGKYTVNLYARANKQALKSTTSDPETGEYIFNCLLDDAESFFVTAFDHAATPGTMGASDRLVLTPMVLDF